MSGIEPDDGHWKIAVLHCYSIAITIAFSKKKLDVGKNLITFPQIPPNVS